MDFQLCSFSAQISHVKSTWGVIIHFVSWQKKKTEWENKENVDWLSWKCSMVFLKKVYDSAKATSFPAFITFSPITSFIQLSSLVKQDFQYFGAWYLKDLWAVRTTENNSLQEDVLTLLRIFSSDNIFAEKIVLNFFMAELWEWKFSTELLF